jgi:hypothetical protein
VETLLSNEAIELRAFGDLFFISWRQKGTPEMFRTMVKHEEALLARFGGKPLTHLTLISAEAVMKPSGELQAAIDERAKKAVGWVKAEALVIAADGFRASLMRSILAGVALVQRPAHPYKVTGDVGEACAWIAPHVTAPAGQTASGEDLRRMLGL